MTYTQKEVDDLINISTNELIKKLEKISFKQRKVLQAKGKLLCYGLHLHLIPKHSLNKLKVIMSSEENAHED